jgi:hypothetical protein
MKESCYLMQLLIDHLLRTWKKSAVKIYENVLETIIVVLKLLSIFRLLLSKKKVVLDCFDNVYNIIDMNLFSGEGLRP